MPTFELPAASLTALFGRVAKRYHICHHTTAHYWKRAPYMYNEMNLGDLMLIYSFRRHLQLALLNTIFETRNEQPVYRPVVISIAVRRRG